MNKIDLNTITYEQIVKILGIFNKMLESGLLEVDFEKSTAYLNIDDCSAYLEQQIKKLKQENGNLKKQYCERTDCSGRIGNSKKVEELQNEKLQLKKVIDKAREELKKGLHELDIRRREEVYIEQYIEEALNMLKEVE